MLLPRLFSDNLLDDMDELMTWPDEKDFFGKHNPLYGKHVKNLMKTDVKETDDAYEVDVDLPGFRKEELSVSLENGYLSISAAKGLDRDEKDKKGNYIRRERYAGSCTRSFYVGEDTTQEDVAAKFEDGILHLTVRKKEIQKVEQKDNRIAIEG